MDLIDSLIREGWLKTSAIIDAFRKIKRADFLPEGMKDLAELNEALPIGYGQTISQPLVVAFMLEQLSPEKGDKILDVGSGSGWTTALLAEIVNQQSGNKKLKIKNKKGRVIAIEVIPELKEFGEKNVAKYDFLAPYRTESSGAGIKEGIVEFICTDGSKGYEKEAPFDRILASASAAEIPSAWKEQIKIGGRIVTPIGTSIWLFIKKSPSFAKSTEGEAAEFEEIEYPGFTFVPLITK
ncbi:protein-L-isoaspartate O-methyltransferase [Patescibacteria group bacterium]|nr:protein-L-isoaspartate O-methyltransferase [Patescibacteria group bacterium]MBU4481527.1 protein-L-isoaspartate O-methyltransferase [Patescibacteria group bacterium]